MMSILIDGERPRLYVGTNEVHAVRRGTDLIYGPPWVPAGAAWHLDFAGDRAWVGGAIYGTVAALIASARASFARASTGTYQDAAGLITSVVSGSLRRGDRGALIEPAATNDRANSENLAVDRFTSNAGGSLALTGSEPDPNGGTTGFTLATFTAANDYLALNASSAVVAGQTWSASIYLKGTAGEIVGLRLARGGSGPPESSSSTFILTGEWQRETITHMFFNDQTQARLDIGRTTGGTTVTSLGLAWPQVELGSTATSYFPTSGTVATRAADALTLIPPADTYDITATFEDDSTQALPGVVVGGGGWSVPTDLDRRYIKAITGVVA